MEGILLDNVDVRLTPIVCGSLMQSGHVGNAVESNKWAYVFRSCLCPER